ncbi:hypothetical protein HBP99_15175 [Listeria booriae]|uniref:hypothetical protein n=1 Tax=Listeria booriae TaxID=1552123 RepID=UPI001628EF8D|nr:hypothetical protein [Listeria booriae]MBC1233173.1 hypothetical protein [Listeria booriae]MBC2369969.1 hypothetical protein [Listeria booriae]
MSPLVKLFIDAILDENSNRTIDDVPESIKVKVRAGLDDFYGEQKNDKKANAE